MCEISQSDGKLSKAQGGDVSSSCSLFLCSETKKMEEIKFLIRSSGSKLADDHRSNTVSAVI